MKKIVRLTESDLVRLVKRVINEQNEDCFQDLSDKFEAEVNAWIGAPDANGRRPRATQQNLINLKNNYRPNFENSCKALATFVNANPNVIWDPETIKKHPKSVACLNGYGMEAGGLKWDATPKSARDNFDAVSIFISCLKSKLGVNKG